MTNCISPVIEDAKLLVRDSKGKLVKAAVRMVDDAERIHFLESAFILKDEIKVMKGAKWDGEHKRWTIESCPRNRFQLEYLKGGNPYAWFDRPLEAHEYERALMPHQCDLSNQGLTYRNHIWAAEMGVGKTLAAQEVIERSGHAKWFWVGPKSSIPNIKREFRKWELREGIDIEYFTYEGLVTWIDAWQPGDELPRGVVFDESSKLKTPTSQRSKAGQRLADMMREEYGHECWVLLMSGTPSPKSPLDWWSQCEIAYPGFLREGSVQALERRLAFMVQKQFDQGIVMVRQGWRDDERKCNVCGEYAHASIHDEQLAKIDDEDFHEFEASINEVAYMHERLQGLVTFKHKQDCLNLPEKRYREVQCEPKKNVLRVAKIIAQSASNAMTAMTMLRELSDGFQYREKQDGTMKCNHCEDCSGKVFEWLDPNGEDRNYRDLTVLPEEYAETLIRTEIDCPKCKGTREMPRMTREVIEVPCPKEAALKELLAECEEAGRIVIAAGFTGSVDRCVRICHKEKWNVVRLDGRGYYVQEHDGTVINDVEPLDYWAENIGRVAFVMHPESGGMSLTLTEARMMVYWSNSFKPEYRSQSEDRIHRKGMDENLGCEIVDLIHLPTDQRTLTIIRANRKLELMTMGEVADSLGVVYEGSLDEPT